MYVCVECGEDRDRPRAGECDPWTCDCGGRLGMASTECSPGLFPKGREIRPGSAVSGDPTPSIGLAPGRTPLLEERRFWTKAEYRNPTGSFKDRGAAFVVTAAVQFGVKRLAADSSGNAALALAALAGRVGVSCDLFVPERCPEERVQRLEAHGAQVYRIEGARSAVADACLQFLSTQEAWDAGHARNPWFLQGTRTFFYELLDQLNGEAPDAIVFPAGNGTLLLGAWHAIQECRNAGRLEEAPRLIAAQVEGYAPLQQLYDPARTPKGSIGPIGEGARGLMVDEPPLGPQVVDAIRQTGGEVLALPEQVLGKGARELVMAGHPGDSCNAVAWAAASELAERGADRVVVALTGSGSGTVGEIGKRERSLQ